MNTIDKADMTSSDSESKVANISLTKVFVDSVYQRRKNRGEIKTDFTVSSHATSVVSSSLKVPPRIQSRSTADLATISVEKQTRNSLLTKEFKTFESKKSFNSIRNWQS
jgi:hypothetical protein